MEIIKAHLKNGQYIDRIYPKNTLTFHHSAGTTALGAINWWDQTPARVGTAYVVDTDGKIYEAFPPQHWAYHIGINGDDDFFEKHNLGIELVNPGWVIKEDKEFRFYPLYPNLSKYKVYQKGEVENINWRGYKYYVKYTEAQIASAMELAEKLILEFGIKMQEPKLFEDFWEYKPEVIEHKIPGIWSHSTLRKDKSDIWPYKPLLEAIKNLYLKFRPYEEIVEPVKVVKKYNKKDL